MVCKLILADIDCEIACTTIILSTGTSSDLVFPEVVLDIQHSLVSLDFITALM